MKQYVKLFEDFKAEKVKESSKRLNEAEDKDINLTDKQIEETYGNLIFYTSILKNANNFTSFLKETQTGKDLWKKLGGSKNELQRTVKQSMLEVIFKAMDPTLKMETTYEDSAMSTSNFALDSVKTKATETYLEITNKDGESVKVDVHNPFGMKSVGSKRASDSKKEFPQDLTGFEKLFGDISDDEVIKRAKKNFSKAVTPRVKKLIASAEKMIKEEEDGVIQKAKRTVKGWLKGFGL